MTRKIKGLGLAFVAIAAMSMAAAAGAQAGELHATSTGSVTIFGQQGANQHVFKTKAGTVVAKQATFEATSAVTAQELTTTATYNEAQAFGQAAQIVMNGCKYTLTNKSAAGVTTALTAYVDVAGCTTGKQIEVKTAICTVTVPEQTGLAAITFTNSGSAPNEDVLADIAVSGISYQNHGALCPNYGGANTVTLNDGTYTGTGSTFQAFTDTGTEQVTKNSHQYNKLKLTGTQVGLLAT